MGQAAVWCFSVRSSPSPWLWWSGGRRDETLSSLETTHTSLSRYGSGTWGNCLPGSCMSDTLSVSVVQSRGGPLKFELSSWLQIEGAGPEDSGTYRCIAHNNLGSVSASAVLGILGAGGSQRSRCGLTFVDHQAGQNHIICYYILNTDDLKESGKVSVCMSDCDDDG